MDCKSTETAVGGGNAQKENQRLLPKGWGRVDGHSSYPDPAQTLLYDVKDPTLIRLPGISEFSSDLQSMFPDIERSHFSTPHIQLL